MPSTLGLFPAAIKAAYGGMSANQFYRHLQAVGLGARRSEVLRLFSYAKGMAATAGDEIGRDPALVPQQSEMQDWPTKKATGIRQNIMLVYRDRTTGTRKETWYSVITPNGIAREEAVAQAISAYSDTAERYNQYLEGAVHFSAYNMVPFNLEGLCGRLTGSGRTIRSACPPGW